MNQKPRVMYVDGSQKDVVLDGTVTNKNPTDSADPKYKKMNELIYYEVQHKDASGNVTTGGPKVLTSVADVAAGQTKNYSGLAKGIEDDLHVGDRIVVWAVDSGGMTSVNHEHTDLVERAAEISKKVKNITNGDSSFKTETDYKPGDTVEYQGTLKNLKTKVALPKGAIITDELDSNLTVKGDVTLTYYDANDTQIGATQTTSFDSNTHTVKTANEIPVGGYVVIDFKANVAKTATGDIDNIMRSKVTVTEKDTQGNDQTYEVNTDPSNKAIIHPGEDREVQDLKQYIKLDTNTDWTLGTTGVTGHRKDKVNYKFAFTAKKSNSAGISDAEISDIKMAPDELTAPTNVKVKIITPSTTKADTSETVDGTATPSSDGETYSIKIDKSIKGWSKG
ncbi:hypothetical protein QY884_07990 [Latilactobacillus sakei]